MMRNLVVLGCAGLLAFGLSISSFAGTVVDTDGDGIVDPSDNCTLVVNNAPTNPVSGCDQLDGDNDGYGNACDVDYNNNGAADPADLSAGLSAVQGVSTDPNYDLNCNGAADPADLSATLSAVQAVAIPGPSGLACAGTVPCP
jgi:hypothetical protein